MPSSWKLQIKRELVVVNGARGKRHRSRYYFGSPYKRGVRKTGTTSRVLSCITLPEEHLCISDKIHALPSEKPEDIIYWIWIYHPVRWVYSQPVQMWWQNV